MAASLEKDPRIVMTLDAGGTGLRFSAVHGNKLIAPFSLQTAATDPDGCLREIVQGFLPYVNGMLQRPGQASPTWPSSVPPFCRSCKGVIDDRIGLHHAFILPVVSYLYILFFALYGSKPNSERFAKA